MPGPGGPLHSTSGAPEANNVPLVKFVGSTATVIPLPSTDRVVLLDGVDTAPSALASGDTAVPTALSATAAPLSNVTVVAVEAVQENVPLLTPVNPATVNIKPTKALFAPLP